MRVPGRGASCLGVGRPRSGALPPPTPRPFGRAAGAHATGLPKASFEVYPSTFSSLTFGAFGLLYCFVPSRFRRAGGFGSDGFFRFGGGFGFGLPLGFAVNSAFSAGSSTCGVRSDRLCQVFSGNSFSGGSTMHAHSLQGTETN